MDEEVQYLSSMNKFELEHSSVRTLQPEKASFRYMHPGKIQREIENIEMKRDTLHDGLDLAQKDKDKLLDEHRELDRELSKITKLTADIENEQDVRDDEMIETDEQIRRINEKAADWNQEISLLLMKTQEPVEEQKYAKKSPRKERRVHKKRPKKEEVNIPQSGRSCLGNVFSLCNPKTTTKISFVGSQSDVMSNRNS